MDNLHYWFLLIILVIFLFNMKHIKPMWSSKVFIANALVALGLAASFMINIKLIKSELFGIVNLVLLVLYILVWIIIQTLSFMRSGKK